MSGHSCDDDARISQLPDDKRRSDCMERERELHEVQHKNERTIAHQRKKSDETLHRQHRQDASAGECGAWVALFKHDLKGILAYSTISQLGLLVMLLGFSLEAGGVSLAFSLVFLLVSLMSLSSAS